MVDSCCWESCDAWNNIAGALGGRAAAARGSRLQPAGPASDRGIKLVLLAWRPNRGLGHQSINVHHRSRGVRLGDLQRQRAARTQVWVELVSGKK